MGKHPRESTGLNLDVITAPFVDTPMSDLQEFARNIQGILLTPSNPDDARSIFAVYRREMLQEIFTDFDRHEEEIRQIVEQMIAKGCDPMDAITITVNTMISQKIGEASVSNESLRQKVAEYTLLHVGRPFSQKRNNAYEEMTGFIFKGTTVLIGLLESIPEVFERQHQRKATMEELEEMIPDAAKEIIQSLTSTPGKWAINIEDLIAKKAKFIGMTTMLWDRYQCDPEALLLRSVSGRTVLDIADKVRNVIAQEIPYVREILSHSPIAIYGCLGFQAHLESSDAATADEQSIFMYMQKLIVSLMKEYWFPRIAAEAQAQPK
jgi:hypothetical protein